MQNIDGSSLYFFIYSAQVMGCLLKVLIAPRKPLKDPSQENISFKMGNKTWRCDLGRRRVVYYSARTQPVIKQAQCLSQLRIVA